MVDSSAQMMVVVVVWRQCEQAVHWNLLKDATEVNAVSEQVAQRTEDKGEVEIVWSRCLNCSSQA